METKPARLLLLPTMHGLYECIIFHFYVKISSHLKLNSVSSRSIHLQTFRIIAVSNKE